ncbi:MAG: 2-amino-4-hydroxy-6-hydroxymethyldihydropteridine diphosphokinase [Phaeodactylibacter sp.]|nr:2-amino-4-hydroxy-6-hydroxymethyldihydropteridine diphosphokinase [Phaeodactylibacter sp.]
MRSMEPQRHIYIGLGSNLQDRIGQLARAVKAIETQIGPVLERSSIYESEAWGLEAQDNFMNAAIEVRSALDPRAILDRLLAIELQMGRRRKEKWGPRLIDLDLLFYQDRIIQEADLVVPHPQLHLRNFVLIPMLEIAPDWVHPIYQRSIEELYWQAPDAGEVYIFQKNWPVLPEM